MSLSKDTVAPIAPYWLRFMPGDSAEEVATRNSGFVIESNGYTFGIRDLDYVNNTATVVLEDENENAGVIFYGETMTTGAVLENVQLVEMSNVGTIYKYVASGAVYTPTPS